MITAIITSAGREVLLLAQHDYAVVDGEELAGDEAGAVAMRARHPRSEGLGPGSPGRIIGTLRDPPAAMNREVRMDPLGD